MVSGIPGSGSQKKFLFENARALRETVLSWQFLVLSELQSCGYYQEQNLSEVLLERVMRFKKMVFAQNHNLLEITF